MPKSDFDFLTNMKKIRLRRLVERFADCHEWVEVDTTYKFQKILGGLGNTDTMTATVEGRYFEGYSLRLLDQARDEWSIYWADNWRVTLDPPLVGRFRSGAGVFLGTDSFNGQQVTARFLWSGIAAHSVRWEQAWSLDGGKTWETNMTMDFTDG